MCLGPAVCKAEWYKFTKTFFIRSRGIVFQVLCFMTDTSLKEPRRKKIFLNMSIRPFLTNYSCFEQAFGRYWVSVNLGKCKSQGIQTVKDYQPKCTLSEWPVTKEAELGCWGGGWRRVLVFMYRTHPTYHNLAGQRWYLFLEKRFEYFQEFVQILCSESRFWFSGPWRTVVWVDVKGNMTSFGGLSLPGDVFLTLQLISQLLM